MSGAGDQPHGARAEDGKPPQYTPYLLIRATLTDTGDRPLPNGTVFWASPDVLAGPVDALGNLAAGSDVTVTAQISNLGLSPAFATNVEFFWADPSAGIVPDDAHRIPPGPPTAQLMTVPGLNTVLVNAPAVWRPSFVNGGHECLIVRCSSPSEGIAAVTSVQPALDRHVGQRNVSVVPASAPQPFQFGAGNPFSTRESFTLDVRSFFVRAKADRLDPFLVTAILGGIGGAEAKVATRALGLEIDFQEDVGAPGVEVVSRTPVKAQQRGALDESSRFLEAIRTSASLKGNQGTGQTIMKFELEPGEVLNVGVALKADHLGNGEFRVHRLVQSLRGFAIGGISVIASSPPSRRPDRPDKDPRKDWE